MSAEEIIFTGISRDASILTHEQTTLPGIRDTGYLFTTLTLQSFVRDSLRHRGQGGH